MCTIGGFYMGRRKKLPVILDDHEIDLILSKFNPRYYTGHRNKMLLELILGIGTRLSETTDLKWPDINLMTGKVLIEEGKGKKDRILWLPDDLLVKLQEWRERQVKDVGEVTYVFTTHKGKKLLNRYVQGMVKRYKEKAGITKNVTPHTFRHTFATNFYRETKDILKTQKALGHEDVSTTMIYTHIFDEELENAMKKFSQRNINNIVDFKSA